jgi:hypothetical protein
LAGVTAQGPQPGQQIEVLELKADGSGMVTLTLQITNNSDKALELSCALRDNIRNGDCRDVSAISLVDAVNKKRYLPMQDSERICLCTTTLSNLPAKGTTTIWAKFAAPPDTVKTVSAIVPLFLPLDGIPITRP